MVGAKKKEKKRSKSFEFESGVREQVGIWSRSCQGSVPARIGGDGGDWDVTGIFDNGDDHYNYSTNNNNNNNNNNNYNNNKGNGFESRPRCEKLKIRSTESDMFYQIYVHPPPHPLPRWRGKGVQYKKNE